MMAKNPVVQTRTMKTFVALALFVAAASAYTTTLQDRIVLYPHMMAKSPARGSGRIVGGQEAVPNSYPHLVFLLIDSLYVCGGNIFNENTIITAAHCADGANRIQITAGAHDQTVSEPSQQIVISTSHIEHPDWNSFTLSGDVAILYLDSPLTFTAEIDSIALAQSEPAVGDDVNMAGWGKTCDQFNCGVSDVVNQVTVPVLDDSVADEYYGTIDWDRIICIDTTGGMGTCNGDSGGPLMVGDANGPLTSVTSFGSIFGCEVGAPACFTSIPNYLDWLNENGNRK